jgi:hypothetical protein
MDERPLKPDSSLFTTSVKDSIQTSEPVREMKTKDWIAGASIILALSISLIFLFNFRSR